MMFVWCVVVYLFVLKTGVDAGARIVGGFEAPIYLYPYAAAINVQTSTSKFFCGGALYRNQWVITAAQCVDGAVLFTVSLGSATLENEDPNRLIVATPTYFIHPDYDPLTLNNDIGIIEFRMPITLTNYIQPFGHLPRENITMGIQCYVIGWGQLDDSSSSLSPHLHVAYIGPITNEQCKIIYGSQITDNMLCATGSFNQGTCHGDTGGPLITSHRTGSTEHMAVASFVSANGCESNDPSGFTRTQPYNDWIREVTST